MVFFISRPNFWWFFKKEQCTRRIATPRCGILKKHQTCPKNWGEGECRKPYNLLKKELSDNDVLTYGYEFLPQFFPALFSVNIFLVQSIIELYVSHKNCIFHHNFFRFIAWLSECIKKCLFYLVHTSFFYLKNPVNIFFTKYPALCFTSHINHD